MMADSANANLTEDVIASLPVSVVYWKTLAWLQIIWATFAVLGNSLVGTTLLTNQQLRTDPNNIMMANLAIADGIFALVLIFTGYWSMKGRFYPFGELACRFHMLFTVSAAEISNNIIAAMAVVKFIHVSYPFTSDAILKPIVIRGLCVVCWIPPLVYNSMIFLFSIGLKMFLMTICYPIVTVFVSITYTVCFFLIQFIIVGVATGLILRIVHRHQKSIGVLAVGIAGAPSTAATTAGANTSWKAVRTFVLIVAAFFLLQAPLYFFTAVQAICNCLPYDLIYEYVMYPFDMNCVVNVFIYFYMEPRFRKAAIYLLTGGRHGQAN